MLTEQKLKEYLVEEYHPLAIILHGSRASDTNRPHSDWDVVMLVSEDTSTEQVIIDGEAIDVEALKVNIEDKKILDEIGDTFHSAKIIFDTDDTGKNLVERVQQLANAGYKLGEKGYVSRKLFLYRLLNRLRDAGEDNPVVFYYHMGNFLLKAIIYSFQVRGQWSKSVYDAVADIKKNNPDLSRELGIISSMVSDTDKLESAKRIYKLIFKEDFE